MDHHSYQEYLQTENIFKTLIEESPTPVGLYVGRELVIRLVNKAILKVWDKGEEVLGKTFTEALPEMEGQPFAQILDDVFTTGIPYEAKAAEVQLFVDGRLQTYYFNFNYNPIKNDKGEVWAILNTADDVTELVLTRKKLAETEERTRFALQSAELGTWDLDPLNDIVTWDAKCKELYGIHADSESVSYNEVLKHIHPDDRERVNQMVAEALLPEKGGFYDSEFRTINAESGTIRWLRCRGKAYFDAGGRCIRFAGTALDISDELKGKEEQRKLFTLIDNSRDFISLSDISGRVYYVNVAGREMVGLEAEEQFTKPSTDFIMPQESDKVVNTIYPAVAGDGRWSGEVLYRHFKTGEAIPVHGTAVTVYDPITGEPQGRATISRDLRPEIVSRQALIDSEQLLQNITSAAPAALWMSDATGLITYANQTWTKWTGQKPEEVLGTGWLDAILPEDRIRAAEKFMRDIETRRPYEVDFRLLFADGSIHWCIATGNPQYNEDGAFIGYIGACTDVTEKKIIDIELEEKNAELNAQIRQFEFVTDFMPVQLWTAKITGELDYINKQAIDFFGVPAADIIGPKWLEQVHPDDREACIRAWVASLESGTLYQFEFRLRDKDGNYKWHLARALPFISNGEVIKWFGTNTDIDEQKQLQRQKDDFLGIASHELKTPVTSIKAYAQVLGAMLSKEGDGRKATMVEKMNAQLNRLTNLIGDLLDVTKINSGRIQFNKTWFNFNDVVRDNVEDLQHTTTKHVLEMDFGETGEVYSDKDRIGQVITNLITNAIKYSPHANRIIVSTKLEGKDAVVCVQDFGIGIPDDKKDRVFEQFYRVSGDKQHTFPGLGLGLYISAEIVKREGGKMWVNSVEGKGSTFCFSLPVDGHNITKAK
jgi:PAS domain S-box-containing protein